ncbi:MAG: hypothetical protein J6C56_04910 [Alistipes sp.]|nr:hypothetical protein [Alistipes sp.]
MSETKTYVFGEGGNNSQNSFDPNLLLGMMFGGGGFGGFGGGAGFLWPLFLILAWMRNGFGFGGNGGFGGCNNGYEFLSSQINNSTGRELLMQAINGNGNAISQLASTLGCQVGDIQNALHSLSTQICQFSSQTGLGQQQIINSLERGDASLAYQLSQNSCDIRNAIQSCCCDTQRAIAGVEATATRGFADLGYAFRDQTCDLKQSGSANTAAIIAKLDAIEDSRKDRELAEKDRVIATLTARSERQAELQPIYNALQDIQCNQPPVKKICCPEQYIPVNTGINAHYGLIPTYCGYGGYGFPYGGNCFNNAF